MTEPTTAAAIEGDQSGITVAVAADKRRSKKVSVTKPNDPVARFSGEGVSFRAKLFGTADVNEPRGDEISQRAMQLLKVAVKNTGEHKQRIILRINMTGIIILDGVSQLKLYEHPVNKISFISKDATDNRAFGYTVSESNGKHMFFGIKTEKAAEQVVLALRDLFQCVFDLKKKEAEMKGQPVENAANAVAMQQAPATSATATQQAPATQSSPTPQAPVAAAPEQAQPSLGEPELVKEEIKREDSSEHLLDLLANISFVESSPQAANVAAVNAAAWATPQTSTTDPFATNGFGQQQPFGQTYQQNQSPFPANFNQPSQPFQNHSFGTPQQQQQPFGAPQQQQQPFVAPQQQQQQPFGAPQQQPGYGAQPAASPFAQPFAGQQSNTFGQQPFGQAPFGQPSFQQQSFGQPTFSSHQQTSTASSDPFQTAPQTAPSSAPTTNPFAGADPFGSVLQPKSMTPVPAPRVSSGSTDLFSDLNPIGSPSGQPRPDFKQILNPPKPKLNDLAPKPAETTVNNSNVSNGYNNLFSDDPFDIPITVPVPNVQATTTNHNCLSPMSNIEGRSSAELLSEIFAASSPSSLPQISVSSQAPANRQAPDSLLEDEYAIPERKSPYMALSTSPIMFNALSGSRLSSPPTPALNGDFMNDSAQFRASTGTSFAAASPTNFDWLDQLAPKQQSGVATSGLIGPPPPVKARSSLQGPAPIARPR